MYRALDPSNHTNSFLALLLLVAMSVAIGACGGAPDEAPEPAAAPEPQPVALDRAALQDPSRPEAEVAQDAGRRPIDVYEYFGVQAGADRRRRVQLQRLQHTLAVAPCR